MKKTEQTDERLPNTARPGYLIGQKTGWPEIKMKGISSLKRTQRTYQKARYVPVEDILFESEKSETEEAKAPNSTADPVLPTTTVGYSKSSFTRNPHLLHVLTNQFPSPPTSWWLPSPTYAIYIYIYIYFNIYIYIYYI